MKKFKVLSLVLALVFCVAMFAACSTIAAKDSSAASSAAQPAQETASVKPAESASPAAASTSAEASKEVGKKRIVFLVKNLVNAFFVDMADNAKAQCKEYGWECEVLSPIKADSNEEQIQLLEQSLLNPPDAYCIVPADSSGITPAIEEINEAGIPIINVNTKFYDEKVDYVTFVAIENYNVGAQQAEACAKLIGEKGKVIILEGTTGAQTSIDRVKGAKDTFAKYPGIEILTSQATDYNRQKAMTVTQDLLQKYDTIDAIWTAAGEVGLGAAVAVEQAGRKDKIKITTINGYKEVIQGIVDGRLAFSVDDVAWLQGQQAIKCLNDYFSGKTIDKRTVIEAVVVNDSNIAEYKKKFGIQ